DFWYALHEGVGVDKECKLRYVGPLLAMQITGDYFVAGHLDEPSMDDMGEIIREINSGGVRGLRAMGFIPNNIPEPNRNRKYDVGIVQKAFSEYYTWVTSNMDNTDRERWRWSVITAENHLCKHTRLLEVTTALVV
ncbi:hypothetical protein PENSPDRAFT_672785, partial [Peniophora sp. CONT]